MKRIEDALGNIWHGQEAEEEMLNHGVKGGHIVIPFQCERCWMINMEDRVPREEEDRVYVQCIRRASLDAFHGPAAATIAAHRTGVDRVVRQCMLINKTPSFPSRGPMPVSDPVGMGVAVEMLHHSINRTGRVSKEGFISYAAMRKGRSTHSTTYKSSPEGVEDANAFVSGFSSLSLTKCATQSEWFKAFSKGAERRMGAESNANQPLTISAIGELLRRLKKRAQSIDKQSEESRILWKVGAAVVVGMVCSLRGPEIFLLDLGALNAKWKEGKTGIWPEGDAMAPGRDLDTAPYVRLELIGEFKNESRTRTYSFHIPPSTKSGIKVRWWLNKLRKTRRREGHEVGPAFGHSSGQVARQAEFDEVLRKELNAMRNDPACDLIQADDDVDLNYSFNRTFRKSSENRARQLGVETSVQDATNRWRLDQRARGQVIKHRSQREHYSHALFLMPETWRYGYCM